LVGGRIGRRTPRTADKLAVAFRHGQLWLDLKPGAALLALPIRTSGSKGLPFLDASLSVLLVLWARSAWPTDCEAIHPITIADQFLVFSFTAAHSSCRVSSESGGGFWGRFTVAHPFGHPALGL
jgi:hypothetical protein